THTWYNNTMSGEFYNSLFTKNVSYLGALCTASKLSLVRNYPSDLTMGNGIASVGYYFYTYVLLGDPSLQVRTREPQAIDADYQSHLPVGATYFDIFVFDEDENPVAEAYVHIYIDDDIRYGAFTNEEGSVEFEVDPLPEGVCNITVSGQNLIPILGEITISQAEVYLSLDEIGFDDDGEDDSEGNDDGLPNPGETIELNLILRNTGSQSCQGAITTIRTESPWVEIIRGEADYDDLDADETGVGDQPFILSLAPETPDGEEIVFELSIDTNEETWEIPFSFTAVGYNLTVREHFFMDGLLYPGEEQQLLINIENMGQLDTEELTAVLSCDAPTIHVRDEETTYDPIASGDNEENIDRPFMVFASPFAYQGSEVEFHLALTDENGLHDELSFTVLLGEPTVSSPQGPDGYGYWAFDNRDTTSSMAPEYNWIEGRDRLQGLYDPNDTGYLSDHGSKTYVDLPFNFVYYGQEYDEITVGSNGWLCFGRTAQISWQNQEMGSPLAPAAMLAPFWKDLHSGEVYTRYDEDEGRFVIEWRDWGVEGDGSATFEVLLFDPRTVPTITGDGEIVFQYEDIPNLERRDVYPREKATIGISSPDRQNFIQITHAGNSNPRTADLEGEMAIRFTTGEFYELGSVEGRVADIHDNWQMEGVRVMIDGTGFFDNSDEMGNYRIDGIPIGTYNVIARMRYYNDAISRDIEIIQDETQEVNLALTHPTFNINIERIEFELRPDSSGGVSFDVWNSGNGPLDYDIKIDYEYEPPEERDDPWDMLFEFNLTDTSRTGDYWLRSVEFDGENLFIAGRGGNRQPPHKIYVINREGEMIRQFDQHAIDSSSVYGYWEMTWNGENLLAIDTYDIVELTREGEPVDTIPNPVDRARSIAWSPERGTIFTKGISDHDILEINTDGEDVSSYDVEELAGNSQRFYGLTWYPEDPEGFKLYMFVKNDLDDGEPRLRLLKLNVETGEFMHVQYFDFDPSDSPEGCTITKLWNPLVWTFIGLISNSDGDRVFGVELGPNLTWINIAPMTESIPVDELQTISVSFFAQDMPEREYDIQLKMYHNAVGDRCDIPVHFIVDRNTGSDEHDDIPSQFICDPPSPNPFNPTTSLRFSLPHSSPMELILYDVSGRKVNQVDFGFMAAGRHTVTIDGSSLPSGIYLARLKAGSISVTQKIVLLK
ncbi:carboxypeptidase regulatory-like domain-containing protein, partial [bacterium]|nr:carboxypeptidase regulatory-like domain-containing protein [bacterium]